MAKAAEPLWGIYIKPGNVVVFKTTNKEKIGYKLTIGKFKKNSKQIFITNHAIKKKLAEIAATQKINGKILGHITFVIKPLEKNIAFGAYCPFSRLSNLPKDKVESLKGLGLASLAEIKILRNLRTRFPKHTITSAKTGNTIKRLRQVSKRGTKVNKPTKLTTEINLIKTHLGKYRRPRRR